MHLSSSFDNSLFRLTILKSRQVFFYNLNCIAVQNSRNLWAPPGGFSGLAIIHLFAVLGFVTGSPLPCLVYQGRLGRMYPLPLIVRYITLPLFLQPPPQVIVKEKFESAGGSRDLRVALRSGSGCRSPSLKQFVTILCAEIIIIIGFWRCQNGNF